MKLKNWFSALFALSPEGRAFFYVTAVAHVALKLLLGLTLVIEDRYGFRSLLAPPQSLVFAGGDIAVCFLVAKLIDVSVKPARRRMVQSALLLPLFVFLVTNFIVHTYFKAFVNRGLLQFNGAGTVEITDYTIAGLTRYSITFILIALASFIGFVWWYPRVVSSPFVMRRRHVPTASLFTSFAAIGYMGTLSQGQVGFIGKNPAFELVRSFASASSAAVARASEREAKSFQDPSGPLFGTYDSALELAPIKRPGANVLWVLIESLPFEQTSLDGKGGLGVLRELAQDGVTFRNFRTVFPATSRSFLTYHCGIYPTAGASTATKYQPDYRCESLLDVLKQRGYRTGFFTAPMFTYDNLHRAAIMKRYDAYEDFLSLRKNAKKNAFDAPAVEEEAVSEALLSFLEQERTKPFFATYFMFWNHAPYRLPFEDISTLPALERYQRTLAYLDEVLRNTLARMRAQGLLENTIVIVSADHGEGFGIHHGNTNHVGHIYEDDVRIPLLIHVPGMGHHETGRQGSNVDFAPTLAGLLGLPVRPSWQGQDLLSSHYTPRPTLLFGRASFDTNGIVDGNLKYIEYLDTGARSLFDLARDPHEQQNLLESHGREADAYHALIQRWLPVVEARAWAVSE